MASKRDADRLAFEAGIIARATSYRVHLFLGRGQYDRADANTPQAAREIGAAMKAAHPNIHANPIIYAIEPSGHSTILNPALIPTLETTQMEKQKSPGAVRMAALRAKRKAAADASRQGVLAIKAERKAAAEAGKGARKSKAERDAAFNAKMAKRGAAIEAGRKAKADGRKSNGKDGVAKAPRQPTGKRAAILAAAEAGKLPAKPDFSAATHTRFRPRLEQVHEMVKTGDLKGLKAFKWVGAVTSSPKAVMKYRDLAIIALEAQAAKA